MTERTVTMQPTTEPTYLKVPIIGSDLYQLIPVSWQVKGVQRIASTQEVVSTWIRSSIKTNRDKVFYPLLQASTQRVSKRGTAMKTSLVFVDIDQDITTEQRNHLKCLFEDTNRGVVFSTYTPGRAKVAVAVQGRPSEQEAARFVAGLWEEMKEEGFSKPDTACGM